MRAVVLAMAAVAGLTFAGTRVARSEDRPPSLACEGGAAPASLAVSEQSPPPPPPAGADAASPPEAPPPPRPAAWPEGEAWPPRLPPARSAGEVADRANVMTPRLQAGTMQGRLRWSIVWPDGRPGGDRAYLIGKLGDDVKFVTAQHRQADGTWIADATSDVCPEVTEA
jgi:hypothetical protein